MMSFLTSPIRLNKGHTKKGNKVESFQLFLSFSTYLQMGFNVRICQSIFYHIKCKLRFLPPAPSNWEFNKQRAAMKTGELGARETASRLVFRQKHVFPWVGGVANSVYTFQFPFVCGPLLETMHPGGLETSCRRAHSKFIYLKL